MCENEQETEIKSTENENIKSKPKKRGRKPNPEKRSGYFYEEEEKALQDYMGSTDQHFRDRIFSKVLYPAFTKMIESIIRRYGLFTPSEEFEDTFNDAMSYLITKMDKFDPTKGYKAYSYFGTVCKRYLLLKRTQDMKKRDTVLSYDLMFNGGNSDNRTDLDKDKINFNFNTELINKNIEKIQLMLQPENKYNLTDKEIQVGYGLLELLMNWEKLFPISSDRKFNKTSFLYFMKEYTMLSTKDVRDAMKKYKDLYVGEKEKMINE